MIRFLQRDNRLTKALFVVIIAAASVSMVIYLIPGLSGQGSSSADSFATIYPHWYSRFLSTGETVSEQKVSQMARQQIQQNHYPDNPMIEGLLEQRAGQQLVQQQILLLEADKLGIHASDDDVRQYLRTGPSGQVLFPNGQFIGTEMYSRLIADRFNISVKDFEDEVKQDIIVRRLQALITSGVTVGDQEIRDAYRKANIKVKFDYAVISVDDVRKTINPSDGELQSFFQKNAARYASAVPEQRKIAYVAFTPNELPGGAPQASQQEIKQYFDAHQSEYSVPEQARSRHILIKVAADADAKTDAAAKAKADGLAKQIAGGANFADLAKKNSDDPGSKETGGELGFSQRGHMVPAFDNAIFTQKIGETKVVKSQFGYHVIQVEERQTAHTQPLSEVLPVIQGTLVRQKAAQAEENFARVLTAEAIKNGLDKTAAAHRLQVVTTPFIGSQGVISALPDGSQLLSKAFQAKQGDAAQYATTGEGYAVFQVAAIAPAHAPNFAEFKSQILDNYREEKLPALLGQKTKDLSDKARSMNDLAKAAKAVGASLKTSELVGLSDQVPDFGQVGQIAPQLFNEMAPGNISGPINAQRTGVVAKLLSKQEPSADEINKNLDQTRDQMLAQRRSEAFSVFMSGVLNDYKKHNRIRLNAKAKGPEIPGM
jgi:peptidyl-prolyl cis-trans isomerase D